MFDITKIAVANTADCMLAGPDGKPLLNPETGEQCSITMFGPASDECAEMRADQQQMLIDQLGKEDRKLSAQEDRELTAANLAKVTRSFNGFTYPGKYSTSAEMFAAAYADPKMGWLTPQANGFFGKWGNFCAMPAKKSTSTSAS